MLHTYRNRKYISYFHKIPISGYQGAQPTSDLIQRLGPFGRRNQYKIACNKNALSLKERAKNGMLKSKSPI